MFYIVSLYCVFIFQITHNSDSLFKFGENCIKSMILSQKKERLLYKKTNKQIILFTFFINTVLPYFKDVSLEAFYNIRNYFGVNVTWLFLCNSL